VSGLFVRRLIGPLAIMLSAARVPVKSTQSDVLHWLKWGVPHRGPTGWVHYSVKTVLSNSVALVVRVSHRARASGS
jgi:hypothetical protein